MLVPRIADVSEVLDLSLNHREILWKEIEFIANSLKEIYIPDKLNIAMLGNIVNQLHVHIVARFKDDIAFPNTIWAGDHPKAEYENPEAVITKLRKEIGCRVRKA
jgi:diadenosine tetraphosphate (Ap4A) HIT family hydrolase